MLQETFELSTFLHLFVNTLIFAAYLFIVYKLEEKWWKIIETLFERHKSGAVIANIKKPSIELPKEHHIYFAN